MNTSKKRSKVHPLSTPKQAGQEAPSGPTPELQLMDVSQQVRSSASIHKYHGSCHAVLDGLNINDGTNFNHQAPPSRIVRTSAGNQKPVQFIDEDGELVDPSVARLGSRLRIRRVETVLKHKAIENLIAEVKKESKKGGSVETVSSVMLTSLEIDELQMKDLCDGISQNGGVRCFDLHGQMLSQYEGYQVGGALFSCPKLTAASIRSCVARDDVLRCIGSNLGFSKSLTSLDLSSGFAPIEISGSALLGVGLKRNRSLTDINLSCNNLGTEGVLNIASSLIGHNRMKRLNFAFNNIPPEGGTWLAQVHTPHRNPNLPRELA